MSAFIAAGMSDREVDVQFGGRASEGGVWRVRGVVRFGESFRRDLPFGDGADFGDEGAKLTVQSVEVAKLVVS